MASFVQLARKRDEAVLVELFAEPDALYARGPEGAFVHELVVPFVRAADEVQATQKRKDLRPLDVRRRFAPGAEWLYAKLYAGQATQDDVLRRLVQPLAESALESGAADCWFFVRYADPDHHVRVRVHGAPEHLQAEVQLMLQRAASSLLDEGLLWRVQLDTYEREVERYGGPEGVLLAERLFHADSHAAVQILDMLEPGDEGLDERWRLALCGVDLLLADFGLDADARRDLLAAARDSLLKQLDAPPVLLHQMGANFRTHRASLELLLAASDDHPLAPGLEVLRARSADLRPIVVEIQELEREQRLSVPLRQLLVSYTHMHVNRMLRSAHRQQEAAIYDSLVRLHRSRLTWRW